MRNDALDRPAVYQGYTERLEDSFLLTFLWYDVDGDLDWLTKSLARPGDCHLIRSTRQPPSFGDETQEGSGRRDDKLLHAVIVVLPSFAFSFRQGEVPSFFP